MTHSAVLSRGSVQHVTQIAVPDIPFTYIYNHAVAQLVEALRYKPEGRGFDSR
jgi:hypothetical protein